MDRLTEWNREHTHGQLIKGDGYTKLARYEDTGLEPEDIISAIDMAKVACALQELSRYKELGTIENLSELVQAQRDGRVVVLPCLKGDVLWSFYNYPAKGVYSFSVVDVSTLNRAVLLNTDSCGVIPAEDVGRTVFLTREEAEAALKGDS